MKLVPFTHCLKNIYSVCSDFLGGPPDLLFFAYIALKPSDTLELFWTSSTSLPHTSFRLCLWLKTLNQLMSVEARIAVKQRLYELHRKLKKVLWIFVSGIWVKRAVVPLQRREIGADPSPRRQGRLPLRWSWKWRSYIWDYSSAVVQDSVWHCSLQDRFMLARGEL